MKSKFVQMNGMSTNTTTIFYGFCFIFPPFVRFNSFETLSETSISAQQDFVFVRPSPEMMTQNLNQMCMSIHCTHSNSLSLSLFRPVYVCVVSIFRIVLKLKHRSSGNNTWWQMPSMNEMNFVKL